MVVGPFYGLVRHCTAWCRSNPLRANLLPFPASSTGKSPARSCSFRSKRGWTHGRPAAAPRDASPVVLGEACYRAGGVCRDGGGSGSYRCPCRCGDYQRQGDPLDCTFIAAVLAAETLIVPARQAEVDGMPLRLAFGGRCQSRPHALRYPTGRISNSQCVPYVPCYLLRFHAHALLVNASHIVGLFIVHPPGCYLHRGQARCAGHNAERWHSSRIVLFPGLSRCRRCWGCSRHTGGRGLPKASDGEPCRGGGRAPRL